MATDLNALAARITREATDLERKSMPLMVKRLRDADPDVQAGLRLYVEAVKWALEHPNAGGLPAGSIVAGVDCTFIKHADAAEPGQPWSGGPDRRFVNDYTDDEIDDMLQQGEAKVLRVGDGTP